MNRQITSVGIKFLFSDFNLTKLRELKERYPLGRQQSVVIAALDLGQRQNQGWVSQEIIEEVARQLEMPSMRVCEIATFYTMFNLQPVGKYVLQVCVTTPCWLRGSDEILATCQAGANKHGTDVFTVVEVECLGACINAPVIQINDDFHENLTSQGLTQILDRLSYDKNVLPEDQD